jgi:hypothetical protein
MNLEFGKKEFPKQSKGERGTKEKEERKLQ